MSEARIDAWIARQEIRELLYRYCRALDRMDEALARTIWHEDGTADYVGMYRGSGQGFIDWVWKAHEGMERHSHQITNVLIEPDGDRAVSEACATVALWQRPAAGDDRRREIVVRGRYLDRWSRRGGRWAIDHRVHVVDLQTVAQVRPGEVSAVSRRDRDDASYDFFA